MSVTTSRPINLAQLAAEAGGELSADYDADEATTTVWSTDGTLTDEALGSLIEAHEAVPSDPVAQEQADFEAKVLAHPVVQELQAELADVRSKSVAALAARDSVMSVLAGEIADLWEEMP